MLAEAGVEFNQMQHLAPLVLAETAAAEMARQLVLPLHLEPQTVAVAEAAVVISLRQVAMVMEEAVVPVL